MKEDIEYLEEFIKQYKIILEEYKDDVMQSIATKSCYFDELPIQAIENLIKVYKELESDLYSANQIISEQIDLLENSISKDKIREKLYKIESTYSQINGNYFNMNKAIQVLKELLEEGE